jgi:hypothetical protein
VYYHASPMHMSDILHERWCPLPHTPSEVRLVDGFAYRYVSERSDLWKALHRGRLTSSRVAGLLNFWQPTNARALGFKGSQYEGYRRMLDAYEHLLEDAIDARVGDAVEGGFESNLRLHRESKPVAACRSVEEEEAVELMKARKAKHLRSVGDIARVRMSWGSAQEASTMQVLCQQWGDAEGTPRYFLEVGMMEADEQVLRGLGYHASELPPLGSTPDCLACAARSREDAIEAFAGGGDRLQVVEVKNTAPFRISRRKKAFELSDRGPRERVDASMVPQLQWHMLMSQARSAYLVSRSATKGTNVFEVQRDDEYLSLLLGIVKVFYSRYVKQRRVPPKNALSDLKEHKQLLLKTKEIAWKATLRERIEHTPLDGADLRAFLD